MSGQHGTHIDSSIFTKPPPNFKIPSTSPWPNSSPSSPKKIKREERFIPERQSTPNRSLMNDKMNYKNNSSVEVPQTTPQYVLTATQSFTMTPMSNVQVVPPSSVPIQNPPVAVDPSYYAFYYDPKSTSGYNPAAFTSATPVSYTPSLGPFAVSHAQYPPPLPPVPPPQNPPPPPPPPTSSTSSYSPAYSTLQYSTTPPQYILNTPQYNTTPQYSPTTPQYSPATPQYNQTTPQYNTTPPQYSSSFAKPAYYKRTSESEDHYKKNLRKRKKPLSQNIPQRKDWSVEEAKRALEVEKDCNKRNKRQSLIIKFPDLELNRLIVANFHKSIDSVHFQQPSTPRFCFVTLQDSADPEMVIQQLNKIPFGQGYLTAEFKKDREDEINIGPEDIDPLTLYVGNLAQDVTKEDMVKAYPRQKRIDIGYAKKMKYTRYAFVSFKTVEDSIDAFQSTHATQMYSKSLIVRFRRLHGTVGMPGEPKPQPPSKHDAETPPLASLADEKEPDGDSVLAPWDIDISRWEEEDSPVKRERESSFSDDEMDTKPIVVPLKTRFMPGSAAIAFSLHKPKVVHVKPEIPDPKKVVKSEMNPRDDGEVVIIQDSSTDQPLSISPNSTTSKTLTQQSVSVNGVVRNVQSEIAATIKQEEVNMSNTQLDLENMPFPMPILLKEEVHRGDTENMDELGQDTSSILTVDDEYIRKMFTPISVKIELDDDKKIDVGISSLQNEHGNLTDASEVKASSQVTKQCDSLSKDTEPPFKPQDNHATRNCMPSRQSTVDVNEGSDAAAQKKSQQGNQSQEANFEFGDWMNMAPTVKNEPVEADDMDDGVDSSGDDEFNFNHILNTTAKKTRRVNRFLV